MSRNKQFIPALCFWKGEKIMVRKKLTKKFLMNLPEGTYLVSNVFYQYGIPVYTGVVSAIGVRERQWRAIVEVSANQRLCYVFKSEEDAGQWLSELFQVAS